MKKAKTVVGKAAKVLGVTCIALGGAALIASGAAVKALNEGAVYLAGAVKRIIKEPEAETVREETAAEETVTADIPAEAEEHPQEAACETA